MSPFLDSYMEQIDRAAARRVSAEEFKQGRKVLETLEEIRAAFPLIEAPRALLDERDGKARDRRFNTNGITGFGALDGSFSLAESLPVAQLRNRVPA